MWAGVCVCDWCKTRLCAKQADSLVGVLPLLRPPSLDGPEAVLPLVVWGHDESSVISHQLCWLAEGHAQLSGCIIHVWFWCLMPFPVGWDHIVALYPLYCIQVYVSVNTHTHPKGVIFFTSGKNQWGSHDMALFDLDPYFWILHLLYFSPTSSCFAPCLLKRPVDHVLIKYCHLIAWLI